jgi:hypothetical protein
MSRIASPDDSLFLACFTPLAVTARAAARDDAILPDRLAVGVSSHRLIPTTG